MTTPKILGFSGSLRKESHNTRLVKLALAGAAARGAQTTFLDLREFPLPVFDEDLEARDGEHPNARRIKDLMITHHGFVIACPEYNSSITAALKNMIDWATRPAPGEKSLAAFAGKVVGLVAASPGALGGLRGLVHVRAILGNIGVIVLPQQAAVGRAHEAFNADGTLKDAKQQSMIENIGGNVAETAAKLNG